VHQRVVADSFVLHSKQVVERRLRWIIGSGCVIAQLGRVLGGDPTENRANFGEFFLCRLD